MIDPALTRLMMMLMRAGLRHAWRSIKKPAGAFFAVFMLAMISFGVLPSLAMSLTSDHAARSMFGNFLAGSLPVIMFVMTALLIASDSGEGLLELKPAELQFVLAGPFTNSHILSYRLVTLLVGWIPLSAFFSLILLPRFGSFVGGFFGIALGGSFIMLIAFQYTLIKPRVPPLATQSVRLLALLSIAAIAIESSMRIIGSPEAYSLELISGSISGGWAATILGIPFRPFAAMMESGLDVSLVANLAWALGLMSVMLLSCYQTNGGFSELAVAGVGRRIKKLERVKGGNVYGISSKRSERTQWLPMFGWMGGFGPVAWSQITSVLRRTGRLIPGIVVLACIATAAVAVFLRMEPDGLPEPQRVYAVPIAIGASVYVGFLFVMTAQTGFTANRRLLTWYQVMPIHPFAIATGMASGTVTVLIAIEFAFCLPALVVTTQTWIASLSLMFAGASFSLAFSTVINFIAVVTGLRPMPQGTPDVFQGARGLIFMFVMGLTMVPIILFGAGTAALAGGILGFSWTACSIAGGLGMLMPMPILWWHSGNRFVQSEPTD